VCCPSALQAKELIEAGALHEEDDAVPAHIADACGVRMWDCESVLSRQTNLDNHPGLLQEPQHSRRLRMTSRPGPPVAQPAAEAGAGGEEGAPRRRRGESQDEKRERKAEVKVQQRAARQVKKATKLLYKAGAAGGSTGVEGGARIFPV
jgi:hypothetical protein